MTFANKFLRCGKMFKNPQKPQFSKLYAFWTRNDTNMVDKAYESLDLKVLHEENLLTSKVNTCCL